MNTRIYRVIAMIALLVAQSCKDELADVKNKNEPTAAALKTESGLIAFGKGGAYVGGMGTYYASVDDQLGPRAGRNLGYLTTMIFGLHDAMGDVIYVPWGNQSFRYANNPTDFTLDDGSVNVNPIGVSQPFDLRLRNDRAYGAANTFLMEWTQCYFLNNSMNILLSNIPDATFTGDSDTKQRTLKGRTGGRDMHTPGSGQCTLPESLLMNRISPIMSTSRTPKSLLRRMRTSTRQFPSCLQFPMKEHTAEL